MTQPPDDGDRTEDRHPGVDRRTVLKTAGLVGAALGAGCLSGTRGDRDASDADRPPRDADGPGFERRARAETYRVTYRWSHGGRRFRVALSLPRQRYLSAKRAARSVPRCYADAIGNSLCVRAASQLGRQLDSAGVDSPVARIAAAASFARHVRYVTDREAAGTVEYPKYVAETLTENGGDCEDVAALLAGVLSAPPFDYDADFVFFSGHVGVGVDPAALGAPVEPLLAAGGRDYYYVDASTHVPLGRVPEQYRDPGVVAVYDGGWRVVDAGALAEHATETVATGDMGDLRDYVGGI